MSVGILSAVALAGVIAIALHEDAIVYDQLAACFHAEVLEFALRNAFVSGHLGTVHTLHMDNLLEAARHGTSVDFWFKFTDIISSDLLGLRFPCFFCQIGFFSWHTWWIS